MTKNLIIPVCGRSTRFPNLRPKWMLTCPNSNFMVVQAILGLELDKFDKIYLVALKDHEKEYKFSKGLKENLKIYNLEDKVKIILLNPTESQPETIYRAIVKEKITGSIFIKDCDSFFNVRNLDGNCVVYSSLTDFDTINPNNKSYINIGDNDLITNIIEKEIISTTFCCGGYGFESAQEFAKTFEKIHKYTKNLYISDIIFDLTIEGENFKAIKGSDYLDWGRIEEWHKYRENFSVLFVDIDGVLVKNSSQYLAPYIGESGPLQKNIDVLRKIDESKTQNAFIILTTSRPEKYRVVTIKQLEKFKIPYTILMMGLPHCKRILVNDYSAGSNPRPSAVAINLVRDGDDLENYL